MLNFISHPTILLTNIKFSIFDEILVNKPKEGFWVFI